MTLSDLKVIHLFQALSNAIFLYSCATVGNISTAMTCRVYAIAELRVSFCSVLFQFFSLVTGFYSNIIYSLITTGQYIDSNGVVTVVIPLIKILLAKLCYLRPGAVPRF